MKISVSLASQASKLSRWRPAGKEHDNSVLLSSVLRGFPPVCISSRQATATNLEGEKKAHPSHLTLDLWTDKCFPSYPGKGELRKAVQLSLMDISRNGIF